MQQGTAREHRAGPTGYDAELRLHNEVLRRACGVQPHEHVLDTMFFDDPVAAFANVGQALRAAGRLVMMVWQAPERNEWEVAIRQSLAGPGRSAAAASAAPDPFSLAGPPAVEEVLKAARFADVTFTDVRQPVYYGPDVAAALDWVRGFTCTSEILNRLDQAAAARALGQLRETLAAHMSGNGVWFDSRAWIVTARRP